MGQRRLRAVTTIVGAILIAVGVILWIRGTDVVKIEPWLLFTACASVTLLGVLLLLSAVFSTTRTRSPMNWQATIDAVLSPDHALAEIERYAAEAGGSVNHQDDSSINAVFGSQLAVRIMGVTTRYGVDRLPYRLEAVVTRRSGGARVDLNFFSDEGLYLTRLKMTDRAYEERFRYVTAVLQSRLT